MARAATGGSTVEVLEESYSFTGDDGTELWFSGYAPVDYDGDRLSVDEHRTTDPHCFFCRVAGTSHHRDALQASNVAVGAQVILLPEPSNPHDTYTIAVWTASKDAQLGYIPTTLNRTLAKSVPWGKKLDKFLGGVVISEFRLGSQAGPRVGLRILVAPAGQARLRVVTPGGDDTADAESILIQPTATADSVIISCPSCGGPEELAPDAEGFRCKACEQDIWIIRCDKCDRHQPIFGEAAGAGTVEIRCQFCRARNVIPKPYLRRITTEVRRAEVGRVPVPG